MLIPDHPAITPGRGSPESAAWLADKLSHLGLSHAALARKMVELGDDRQYTTILRTIQRMAAGDARLSGEMRVMLTMMIRAPRTPV